MISIWERRPIFPLDPFIGLDGVEYGFSVNC